ncbi:hypothetical protein [Mesorhizobium sp. B2-4-17]|uniref:hypothetical protein n=1 Tax=Mesorhizobium sp. B2-4-17 TaxID=2589932 RepID=UPI00112C0C9A|nr:hypothetical protein [Mesorhizobium sp. B2-4-17]TPK91520.1 hypothetical protein FJ548_04585 [Mesorhizobium sp. B2-4-17]
MFDLASHLKSTRAFAWSSPIEGRRAIDGVKVLLAQEALAASAERGNTDLRAKLTHAEIREAELEYALADGGVPRP